MGSFTSMPKVIPAADSDDTDISYPLGREDLNTFLARCSQQLGSLPPPIERKFRKVNGGSSSTAGEKVRVLQWNVLSQGKRSGLGFGVVLRTFNFYAPLHQYYYLPRKGKGREVANVIKGRTGEREREKDTEKEREEEKFCYFIRKEKVSLVGAM